MIYEINDIKTGFTKLGTGNPSKWTETELICPSSGHTKNLIYKNINTASGFIKFSYTINTTESFSGHCVFRIRSSSIQQSANYNLDGFNGISLQWWGENGDGRKLYLYKNNGVSSTLPSTEGIFHKFDNNIANKTLSITISWDNGDFYISVNDEEVYLKDVVEDDYTYIELGFANYTGTVTRVVVPTHLPSVVINSKTEESISYTFENGNNFTVSSLSVFYNGKFVETVNVSNETTNYTHVIHKDSLMLGNNKIRIVANCEEIPIPFYDEVVHKNVIYQLPPTTSLKQVVETVELIANTNKIEYDTLKSNLENKGVTVNSSDKMSNLIDKVNLFEDYIDPVLWLYKDGDESVYPITVMYNKAGSGVGSYSKNANSIYIKARNEWCTTYFQYSIDLTIYKTLNIIHDTKVTHAGTTNTESRFSVRNGTTNVAYINKNTNITNNKTVIDISTITGVKTIELASSVGGGAVSGATTETTIYKIWLEK